MCKVFPSSLGPVAMRWFNGLRTNSIDSFRKLTRAFDTRFITCSRVPRPLGSWLSMSMREGETLKTYLNRYWEIFNEIDRDYDDVTINTFKADLPVEHDLRKSLTGKPVASVRQLMNRIDKYKRVKEDQLQGKGKERLRWSLKRGEISSQTNTITINLRKTFLGSWDLLTPKWLMLCFENQYNRFWRRLKTSRFSNGRIRW